MFAIQKLFSYRLPKKWGMKWRHLSLAHEEYDQLYNKLKKLESEHPELITPDSPTQRIGDEPVEGLEEVAHRVPMLSIDNTYSLEELREYGQRTGKLLENESIQWVVELKIDGVNSMERVDPGSNQIVLTGLDAWTEVVAGIEVADPSKCLKDLLLDGEKAKKDAAEQ